MSCSRSAISTAFAVVVVVILVVAAGGAYVFLSTNSGQGSISSGSSATSSTSFVTSTHTSTSSSSSSTSSHASTSTSSSSSSTTSASSSSSSSTSTQSTTSCTSTTTTGTSTGNSQAYFNFTTLFLNYHEIAIHFNGTSNGQAYDITSDYRIIYVSTSTIKVVVNLTSSGTHIDYTIHVWKNGTAQSVYFSIGGYGNNYTGTQASSQFFAAMSPYLIFQLFSSPQLLAQFTNSQFVHVTSQGTTTIGPTMVSVTTYAANSLPVTLPSCNGSSTLSRFNFQTGVVSGKSQTLVTSMSIDGSVATSSGSTNYNVDFRITSITPA